MHRTKNSFGWRLYGSSCNPEHCFDCLENRLVTNNETVNIRNTGTRWNTPEYDGTRWNTETPKHRNTRTSLNTAKYSNNNNNNNNISNNNISNNNKNNQSIRRCLILTHTKGLDFTRELWISLACGCRGIDVGKLHPLNRKKTTDEFKASVSLFRKAFELLKIGLSKFPPRAKISYKFLRMI